MDHALVAESLGFEAGGHRLLHQVSLALPRGSLCAIVGPSGAGKSTLLKLLCGINEPSSGRVFMGEQKAHQLSRSPQQLGYVPQDDIVHRSLTVQRVLKFAAELRMGQASAAAREKRVQEVLRLLGLSQRRSVRVRRLSGGQRKRVSIGVELITEPEFLFLDEPTSGLDPGLERQLMHILRSLAQVPRTVVLTTHVMETMDVVDLLAVVFDGHLAFFGPPANALGFFRVTLLRELFAQLKKRTPAAWARDYQRQKTDLLRNPAAPDERFASVSTGSGPAGTDPAARSSAPAEPAGGS